MATKEPLKQAVGAIRVSSYGQYKDGDSPEDQKQQLDRYATQHGMHIAKYFFFVQSGSSDELEKQPMREAIKYCSDQKNQIDCFLTKSIDRFTRGGAGMYGELKKGLEKCDVSLVDIYGVISSHRVNTLDHLGFEYKWSKYSPSYKTELLEAERAKDEVRDIMTRMIGAEIRYTQMGYWMRQPPYGYISEKLETKHHGKRCVLKPHPTEGKYMRTIFEMRAKGTYSDDQIIAEVTRMGCRTRVRYERDRHDRTKIISKHGGEPLSVKAMQKLLQNPIYAGINAEKWTNGEVIRCAFKGLVDIELFNHANRGKKMIVENEDGAVSVYRERPPEHLINKGKRNVDFPYKKYVLCPQCNNALLGSASRGKLGKHYPAYHCSHHGHYYRIPQQELEANVASFIQNLIVSEERVDAVIQAIRTEWHLRNQSQLQELTDIDNRIAELCKDMDKTLDKIRALDSPRVIKLMEEDIIRIEHQIEDLTNERAKKEAQQPSDMEKILARVHYFVEHLDEILKKQIDPLKKAQLFGIIFDKLPTVEDLKCGTPKTPLFTGVSKVFALAKMENSLMVTPRGVEPLIFRMRT